jgi:pantetheine-phosphate adenylyltransferase
MAKAVYPGTFDPLTLGHEDIVKRAARLFGEVIVAIAESRAKRPLFSLDERVHLAREILKSTPNVKVVRFTGLLTELLLRENAGVILRGLRAVSDFEYEFQMAGMNRKLLPDVETVFMTPSDDYMFLSASIVREIASLGGDVSQFVNPLVARKLQEKI